MVQLVATVFLPILFMVCKGALALTLDEKALMFGRDSRQVVLAKEAPWNAVGRLTLFDESICTASFVSPNILVTAAHCFLAKNKPKEVRFSIHNQDLVFKPKAFWMNPTFQKGVITKADGVYILRKVAGQDYGFIAVSQSAPFFLPIWNRAHDNRKIKKITQAGYGRDEDVLMADIDCRLVKWNSNKTFFHRCATLEGDSGSPLLVQDKGQWFYLGYKAQRQPLERRKLEDNIAVSYLAFEADLKRFNQKYGHR